LDFVVRSETGVGIDFYRLGDVRIVVAHVSTGR